MDITIIMIVGAVFIGIFALPNLIYVIKTKNTNSVNLPMYIIFIFACSMFSIYGLGMILDHSLKDGLASGLPLMISNLFCVCTAAFTLFMKCRNMIRAKRAGLTELEY
jgi:uncharacterized protein with PQ loop repeat